MHHDPAQGKGRRRRAALGGSPSLWFRNGIPGQRRGRQQDVGTRLTALPRAGGPTGARTGLPPALGSGRRCDVRPDADHFDVTDRDSQQALVVESREFNRPRGVGKPQGEFNRFTGQQIGGSLAHNVVKDAIIGDGRLHGFAA